jgi:hypothetical protein
MLVFLTLIFVPTVTLGMNIMVKCIHYVFTLHVGAIYQHHQLSATLKIFHLQQDCEGKNEMIYRLVVEFNRFSNSPRVVNHLQNTLLFFFSVF